MSARSCHCNPRVSHCMVVGDIKKKKIINTFHSDNIIIPPLIFDLILKFIQQIDIILQTGTGHKCFNHTAARPADWTLFNLVPRVTTMCT